MKELFIIGVSTSVNNIESQKVRNVQLTNQRQILTSVTFIMFVPVTKRNANIRNEGIPNQWLIIVSDSLAPDRPALFATSAIAVPAVSDAVLMMLWSVPPVNRNETQAIQTNRANSAMVVPVTKRTVSLCTADVRRVNNPGSESVFFLELFVFAINT